MLYYVPLECYRQRYTMQLSAPKVGWFESKWIEHNIPYVRVEPSYAALGENFPNRMINNGSVLDAVGRSRYAMSQIDNLLLMLDRGEIKDSDVIYFDDFWHPGIEAFKYTCDILGKRPRMYAYCWAQSVDQFDFTNKMKHWIRLIEKGYSAILDGVFVANTGLKELLYDHAVCDSLKIHVVGLPFDTKEVLSRMPDSYREFILNPQSQDTPSPRLDRVVFSSRWDSEKNPIFFLRLAALAARDPEMSHVKFAVCSSAPEMKSNNSGLLTVLFGATKDLSNFELHTNLSKEAYYKLLAESKVQFNCADQDWTSFTLLEAVTAGCYPLYPYFRSFSEVFLNGSRFLYEHKNLDAAYSKLKQSILNQYPLPDSGKWSHEEIIGRMWIAKRFNATWYRIAKHMGVIPENFSTTVEHITPPYDREQVKRVDWARL